MPGAQELLIVLLIVVVIFGASRIPQLARSLGKAKTEFNEGLKEGGKDDDGAPAPNDKTSDDAKS